VIDTDDGRQTEFFAKNHFLSMSVLCAASQIRAKPSKHHPRETPHYVETQQAMVHSVEGLTKVRIHSINLVNFDKIKKLYQIGAIGKALHEIMLHDKNLWQKW
jgi:hypothetical protein